MRPYAIVDNSRKPIAIVEFTGEKSTDEEFQRYLEGLERLYLERKPIAIIFDATKAPIPKLSYQKKQALWISIHWKLIQTYCKGTAYVIPNRPLRTVLKMIFSFQNQPVPYKIFSNFEDAESYVQDLFIPEEQLSNS